MLKNLLLKTVRWLKQILCLHVTDISLYIKCVFFYSGRIRTLVAIATYSSHRLIMGKVEIDPFLLSYWRNLIFFFSQIFLLSTPSRFICLLSKSHNLIGCRGDMNGRFSKNLKNLLHIKRKVDEAETLHTFLAST